MGQTNRFLRVLGPVAAALIIGFPGVLRGASGMLVVPSDMTVGKYLQVSTTIKLSESAPADGVVVTLTSHDPGRLLFARDPESAGSASITLLVRAGFRATPEFCMQALADTGPETYQVSAPGYETVIGTVHLAPSAIAIAGPLRGPSFTTTTHSGPARISLYSVLLDSSSKIVAQQAVAGGRSVPVEVTNSNKQAGTIDSPMLTIAGGSGGATTEFVASAPGETLLSLRVPAGFSTPAQFATLKAIVATPGIALTDQLRIGKNLEVGGFVGLGAPAPEQGAQVTLTSENPDRLLLSLKPTEKGSKSITILIPAGSVNGTYYLQALADSGTAAFTAVASGYQNRTGTALLTPSGVVVTAAPYGPPDEAEVMRKEGAKDPRGFVLSLREGKKMPLAVWTVQLDPVTKRGADITVQPLRPGVSLQVSLSSSNPAVGKPSSPATFSGGDDHAIAEFTPLGVGSTTISTATPPGFTTPENSSLVSIVKE